LLERVHPFVGAPQFGLELRGVAVDLFQLLGLELPLELQLPQIADKRPLLRGQSIRLALERLQAFGCPACERLGASALRGLRACEGPKGTRGLESEERKDS
jgi:hypothetical protein